MVEITYDREDEQPSNIEIGEDTPANEMGVESIAVWNGLVGLISLKEANNTSDVDASAEVHDGDISPQGEVNTNVSRDTSGVPHVHKKLTQGNHPHTGIEMIRPSISGRSRMDHEEDQLECKREQGNVTEIMTSFGSKADKGEASRTPMDETITGMPLHP